MCKGCNLLQRPGESQIASQRGYLQHVSANSAGGDAVTEVTYSMLLPSIAVVLFKLPDSLHITALQTVIRQSRLSDYRSCCSSGWVSVHGAVRLISWSGMKRPLHESSEML